MNAGTVHTSCRFQSISCNNSSIINANEYHSDSVVHRSLCFLQLLGLVCLCDWPFKCGRMSSHASFEQHWRSTPHRMDFVLQGDCLIELPTDLKAPASWVRICATKKVNRFRPPEVATAMAERDQASERLQVCIAPHSVFPPSRLTLSCSTQANRAWPGLLPHWLWYALSCLTCTWP